MKIARIAVVLALVVITPGCDKFGNKPPQPPSTTEDFSAAVGDSGQAVQIRLPMVPGFDIDNETHIRSKCAGDCGTAKPAPAPAVTPAPPKKKAAPKPPCPPGCVPADDK